MEVYTRSLTARVLQRLFEQGRGTERLGQPFQKGPRRRLIHPRGGPRGRAEIVLQVSPGWVAEEAAAGLPARRPVAGRAICGVPASPRDTGEGRQPLVAAAAHTEG
eukprot:scaffold20421_cov101-Isochrysis_galbana.AAC.1